MERNTLRYCLKNKRELNNKKSTQKYDFIFMDGSKDNNFRKVKKRSVNQETCYYKLSIYFFFSVTNSASVRTLA